MKNKLIAKLTILIFALSILVHASVDAKAVDSNTENSSRKIVIFNNDLSNNEKNLIIKKHNGTKLEDLSLINSVLINISDIDKKNLLKEEGIKSIEDDSIVTINGSKTTTATTTSTPQIIPYGVNEIEADKAQLITTGNLVKVAVLDTGISLSHPDLKANIMNGTNIIDSKKSADDDNGHGSHVAGIIAALNNTIGVVGVAPNSRLYPVKVLDSTGNGYISNIIKGIQWCINNNIQVINLSMGTSTDNQALHDAVIQAYNKGIIIVAASGNSPFQPVLYPAAYPEVISVSAIDASKNIASFCTNGKIDLCAPGVDIYSTYTGTSYATLSGTSMATPYVSGVTALLLSIPSKCDLNNDGTVTTDEVFRKLENTSVDLGQAGYDSTYGYGMVDAYNSIN